MNKDIKFHDLHLHCRTCLTIFTGSKHEIKTLNSTSLNKMLKGIKLKNEFYPDCICDQCFEDIKSFDEFQKKARESTIYLKELLKLHRLTMKEVKNQNYCTNDESDTCFSTTKVIQADLSDNEGEFKNKNDFETTLTNADEEEHQIIDLNETESSENDLLQPITRTDINTEWRANEVTTQTAKGQKCKIINGKSIFNCNLCDRKYSRKTRLNLHIKETHTENPLNIVCKFDCGKIFESLRSARNHYRQKHSTTPILINSERISCKFGCEKTFKTKDTVRSHYRRQHTENTKKITSSVICEDCGRIFTRLASLREHSYQHRPLEDKPFQCELCKKRFVSKISYRNHTLRHKGIKNFECPECGLKKTTKKELGNHMRYHADKMKVSCPFCSKIICNSGNLKRHIQLVHEGIKNFKCRFCEESFGKSETLKHHEMRHTGEKPHKCEICEKSFIQVVALKTHMKTHNKTSKLSKANKIN